MPQPDRRGEVRAPYSLCDTTGGREERLDLHTSPIASAGILISLNLQ